MLTLMLRRKLAWLDAHALAQAAEEETQIWTRLCKVRRQGQPPHFTGRSKAFLCLHYKTGP